MKQDDLTAFLRTLPMDTLKRIARTPEGKRNPALFMALKTVAYERKVQLIGSREQELIRELESF